MKFCAYDGPVIFSVDVRQSALALVFGNVIVFHTLSMAIFVKIPHVIVINPIIRILAGFPREIREAIFDEISFPWDGRTPHQLRGRQATQLL